MYIEVDHSKFTPVYNALNDQADLLKKKLYQADSSVANLIPSAWQGIDATEYKKSWRNNITDSDSDCKKEILILESLSSDLQEIQKEYIRVQSLAYDYAGWLPRIWCLYNIKILGDSMANNSKAGNGSTIKINTNKVSSIASALNSFNNEMENEFDNICLIVKNLDSSWDGPASSHAISKFNSYKSECKSAKGRKAVVSQHIKFLNNNVVVDYEKTENTNKNLGALFK